MQRSYDTGLFFGNMGNLDGSIAGLLAKRAKHADAGRRGEDLHSIAGEERCDRLSEHKENFNVPQQPEPAAPAARISRLATPEAASAARNAEPANGDTAHLAIVAAKGYESR